MYDILMLKILIANAVLLIPTQWSRHKTGSVLFMPYSYNDPTAWAAIANVERERKRKPQPKLIKRKKIKADTAPVDVWRVIHSEHRYIKFNRNILFWARLRKELDNGNMRQK